MDNGMQRQWVARMMFVGLLLCIGALAALPGLPLLNLINDKLRHIAAFFVLAGAAFFAFPRLAVHYRLAVLLALGLAVEAVQLLIPYRESHLDDWAASFVGACLFELFVTLFRRIRNRTAGSH